MPEERARSLLSELAVRMPGLVHDILDILHEEPLPASHYTSVAPWCKCGNCREMPTQTERVCCGMKPQHCLKDRPVSVSQF